MQLSIDMLSENQLFLASKVKGFEADPTFYVQLCFKIL